MPYPWRQTGITWDALRGSMMHRIFYPPPMMPYQDPKSNYAWWDGSCLCTALVKQGCVALVHVPKEEEIRA